jgi:hypothetical protein
MPIVSAVFTLSNGTATKIVEPATMPHHVTLHNMTKSSNEYVHIGGPGVTDANSIHIDPGETLNLTLGPGDELYAVSDPGGLVVGVLDVRKNA